jgi:hypothetical protein
VKGQTGLTLIEVVLALSLLSALVATCMPLLLSARKEAKAPASVRDVFDLSTLADEALKDPKKAGLAMNAKETAIAWPQHPELGPIHVSHHAKRAADHGWITFEWQGIVVSRYEVLAQEAAK